MGETIGLLVWTPPGGTLGSDVVGIFVGHVVKGSCGAAVATGCNEFCPVGAEVNGGTDGLRVNAGAIDGNTVGLRVAGWFGIWVGDCCEVGMDGAGGGLGVAAPGSDVGASIVSSEATRTASIRPNGAPRPSLLDRESAYG